MKQKDIITAYKALETIADNTNISTKEQWDLYKLRNQLRSHYDFQIEQEQKLQQKYQEFADDKGDISGEHAKEFISDLNDIADLEIEISIIKPQIKMTEGMTFKTMEPLEKFIDFLPPD